MNATTIRNLDDVESLTDMQIRALVAVADGARDVRSVAAAIGRTVSVTHAHLVRLQALGWVDWELGRARTLRTYLRRVQ